MTISSSLSCLAFFVVALPVTAWADRNPDFNADALPILQHQPGLAQFVQAHYVVKEIGVARIPGSEQEAPRPPYIFSAKPRGASGPYYLRLLIQPGPAGHILKVADIRRLPSQVPPNQTVPGEALAPAPQTSVTHQAAPAAEPAESAPLTPPADDAPSATSTSDPTSDTPSGPIKN